jgi:hypothetical protein
MLRLFASRINDFQKLLAKPKSVPPTIATTFGQIEPLGFERFRICELYAELLHCSNMALLNDPRGEEIVRERDTERERLRKEGHSKPSNVGLWRDTDLGNGKPCATSENFSFHGSENADSRNEIGNQKEISGNHIDENHSQPEAAPKESPLPISDTSGLERIAQNYPEIQNSGKENGDPSQSTRVPSVTMSLKSQPVVGDFLKMQFVEAKVLPSVMDLFFAHPWNNFLHNVVYDILTQVLNGPMDKGFNRQLAVDLFTTGQLTEKILHGQKVSDDAQ